MEIEKTTIEKLRITGIKNLDPVTIFLENFKSGEGEITIKCYGEGWSAYWGGMGDRTIEKFFCDVNNDYIIGKLDGGLSRIIYENYDDEKGTPNYKYQYLSKIVDAVKDALQMAIE